MVPTSAREWRALGTVARVEALKHDFRSPSVFSPRCDFSEGQTPGPALIDIGAPSFSDN
jgi:hypothetical protein